MNTIYLRKKRSGNYEISYKKNFTHKFKTKKELEKFYLSLRYCNKIIKATYRKSQTYFGSFEEFYKYIK